LINDANPSISKEVKNALLHKKVSELKEEYNMFGIVDLVLNHTAYNSKWLLVHPESAYNTKDCPHLKSAYELDWALARLSVDFMDRKIPECPSAPYINNEGDLKAVMTAI
jgi:glycogen debranching enzyme